MNLDKILRDTPFAKHATIEEYGEVINQIKEYARQKCKEQREICFQQWYNNDGILDDTGLCIEYAPEPKLD